MEYVGVRFAPILLKKSKIAKYQNEPAAEVTAADP